MSNVYSVSALWTGELDEAPLQAWAEQLRHVLGDRPVDLGLVFMSPAFSAKAKLVLEVLRVHARIPCLVGCSSTGLIANDREMEDREGFVLGLYSLPGASLKAVHLTQEQVQEANGPAYWHLETGITAEETNGWLVFADPYHLDAESWLHQWNEAYAPLPIVGGLASGSHTEQVTQVYLDGEVFEAGAVALSVGGAVQLASVISQGCTPIGETWTITQAERNFIQKIGNRPAYAVLMDTFNGMSDADKMRLRGNLFVGMVVDEYREEFHRGDFLIRNVMGADPKSGLIAVGAIPRVGQTMQFQRRDAEAATEDMTVLLDRQRGKLGGATIYGGCLCCCNGRGQSLFKLPDHDARLVQEKLGPLGLTGFFCNGEIGPVGEQNYLHGYTASLALFVEKRG